MEENIVTLKDIEYYKYAGPYAGLSYREGRYSLESITKDLIDLIQEPTTVVEEVDYDIISISLANHVARITKDRNGQILSLKSPGLDKVIQIGCYYSGGIVNRIEKILEGKYLIYIDEIELNRKNCPDSD